MPCHILILDPQMAGNIGQSVQRLFEVLGWHVTVEQRTCGARQEPSASHVILVIGDSEHEVRLQMSPGNVPGISGGNVCAILAEATRLGVDLHLLPMDWEIDEALAEVCGTDHACKSELCANIVSGNIADTGALEAAVASGNYDEIGKVAHRIKGALTLCHATALVALCTYLERLAKAGGNMECFLVASVVAHLLQELDEKLLGAMSAKLCTRSGPPGQVT